MAAFFAVSGTGVTLRVRLTPKAASDAIDGIGTDAEGKVFLKARVRAVPEKGKANAALEALLAKALNLPRSAVTVVGGQTARLKTVSLEGDPDTIGATLERFSA
ncbi:DUF167 family protein [Consotaella salsifontis]|uniref:UPF0235 protein SAMN05428963_12146 n=1 Tax=Consotaella salsifontis TaxID=1365950 RepID=A0A1T4TA02_9HYPH|nr:DUF167 family protein [Consotaella salsifontis]SKA36998.1 hypothetical protein SAMN05428963_12146 [Consotaella salsifontis]